MSQDLQSRIKRQRLAAEDAIVTIAWLGELEPGRCDELIAQVDALAAEAHATARARTTGPRGTTP